MYNSALVCTRDAIKSDWHLVSLTMAHIEAHAPALRHLDVAFHRPANNYDAYRVYSMEHSQSRDVEQAGMWLHRLAQRLVSLHLDWPNFFTGSRGRITWPNLRVYVNRSVTNWRKNVMTLASDFFPVIEILCVANMQLLTSQGADADDTPLVILHHLQLLACDDHDEPNSFNWPRLARMCPNLEALYVKSQFRMSDYIDFLSPHTPMWPFLTAAYEVFAPDMRRVCNETRRQLIHTNFPCRETTDADAMAALEASIARIIDE
jgi:hypothetical protein